MVDGIGRVTVNMTQFMAFLKDNGAPWPGDAEVVLGEFLIDAEGHFSVSYAFSDECHPTDWADGQPDWMQEGR